MKASKFLIFKVNAQRFALKTSNVINIIEIPKIILREDNNGFSRKVFHFRGMNIPVIYLRSVLNIPSVDECDNNCVLITEVKINDCYQILGIVIDEVIEIAEIDDFLSYPFLSLSSIQNKDMKESIILRNDKPVIIINPNSLVGDLKFSSDIYTSVVVSTN